MDVVSTDAILCDTIRILGIAAHGVTHSCSSQKREALYRRHPHHGQTSRQDTSTHACVREAEEVKKNITCRSGRQTRPGYMDGRSKKCHKRKYEGTRARGHGRWFRAIEPKSDGGPRNEADTRRHRCTPGHAGHTEA